MHQRFAWGAPEFTFTRTQWIPGEPEELFRFFSDPHQLPTLMNNSILQFKIKHIEGVPYQDGTTIDYDLRLYGIPFGWRTLFEDWEPPHRFIDTSLRGPYIQWHHLHTFEPMLDGVLMKDVVHYRVPFGIFGILANRLLVRSSLEKILTTRERRIAEIFCDGKIYCLPPTERIGV